MHDGIPPAPPRPASPQAALDPTRVQAIINALAEQRNGALDQIVNLRSELAIANSRISMLEMVNKQLMEAIPRNSEATLPPPAGE